MPTVKLTQMSIASTLNAIDYFMIVQDGVNKKTTATNIFKNINSGDSIRVNPIQNTIDFSVASKNDANMLIIKGSSDRLGIGTGSPASKVHVIGNVQIGSSAADGVLVQSAETITYTSADEITATVKPLSAMRSTSRLDCNTGVNGLFSLSNGFDGEVKTIFQNTITGSNTSKITLTGLGFNTITLEAVGHSSMIQYIASISKWIVVGGTGATYSTV